MNPLKRLLPLLYCLLLFDCCQKTLQGTYIGQEDALYDQITFTSSNTVEVMFMGTISETTYQLRELKVLINMNGSNQLLSIHENCLEGGGYLGNYCKN